MKNIKIKGFLQWAQSSWEKTPHFEFNKIEFKSNEYGEYATVRPMEIEVEVPDDFDPTLGIIAGLESRKRELRLKLASELAEIDDRISKLQAIEYSPTEAA